MKRRIWQAAALVLGLAALAWALRDVPFTAVLAQLQAVSPLMLAALTALNLGILWLFGLRGWLLARALEAPLPLGRQFLYRLAAFSVSYFTPGTQFGGEPLHVHFLRRFHGMHSGQAWAVVAVDRLIESSVNFAFLSAGVLWMLLQGQHFLPGWALALPPALTLLPFLWLLSLCRGWHLPLKIARLREAETQAGALCREHPGALVLALVVSLLTWGTLIGEYALMLAALGFHLTPGELVLTMTAARLAFLVPVPGGMGALEASQVWALTQAGYSPAAGLSLSLLIRGRDISFGLLGLAGAAWLGQRKR